MFDTKEILRETRDRVAPPRDVLGSLDRRRRYETQRRRVTAAVLGIIVAVAGLGWWFVGERDRGDRTAGELGIFAPIAGWIVYEMPDGLWAVDPATADHPTRVHLSSAEGQPLGWSSDGTELLLIRGPDGDAPRDLLILHPDGTETPVRTGMPRSKPILDAAISPDGSRVAFATWSPSGMPSALYIVDVDGGPPEKLVEPVEGEVYAPTFSPGGTRIAYVNGRSDSSHRVWMVGADGSDAHLIVENERTLRSGWVFGLAWSPTGDRIAIGLQHAPAPSVYTFAPDGSGFTRAITGGVSPSWSPDGSRIAFATATGSLAIANADGSDVQVFFLDSAPAVWHPAS
jgi:dipeptidyl aminopeptidase/acylaminoacyl peptidase